MKKLFLGLVFLLLLIIAAAIAFRDFPNVSVGLENLKISGQKDFDKIDLISADRFDLALDFWSVWNGGNPLKINGINIDKPVLNIYVLEDGRANYDITKPSDDTESSDFLINLDQYSISDGAIHYEDRGLGFLMDMKGVDHTGSGDLTSTIYDLKTKTMAKELSASMDGISYLNKVKADLDAMINMDLDKLKFTLKDNDLKINALKLLAEGWVQLGDEDIDMDLKFKAPSTEFKEFLSLVPGAFTKGYESVKANGNFTFNSTVKGTFNSEKEKVPAFQVNLNLKNGDFKYPDLPTSVSGINAKVNVNSPSSNLDKMVIDIPNFKMKVGNNPIEGNFNLKTPQSDPKIDTKLKGKLDLAELAKAMPLEGVTKLTGLIDADVEVDASMSQLDKGRYEDVDAKGYFNIVNMEYRAEDTPPVTIKKMNTTLSPKQLKLKEFDMKMGKSDVKGNGNIDNILAYFSDEKTMKGDLYLRSSNLDLNEWITEEEGTVEAPESSEKPFDRFDFKLDGQVDIIKYEDQKLLNTIAIGHMTSNELDIDKFSTKVGRSDIKAKGEVRNIFNYLFENQTLHGKVDISGDLLDLNELMGETTEANPDELTEPIMVPENIDLVINTNIGEVLYDDMDLKSLKGSVVVKDEVISGNCIE